MVFGSKSVNEASLGCQGKLSPDPLTFTRALAELHVVRLEYLVAACSC